MSVTHLDLFTSTSEALFQRKRFKFQFHDMGVAKLKFERARVWFYKMYNTIDIGVIQKLSDHWDM